MFAGKRGKWVRLLAMLQEYIYFYNVEWFEICKMSEVFGAKLYCKMSDVGFEIFC